LDIPEYRGSKTKSRATKRNVENAGHQNEYGKYWDNNLVSWLEIAQCSNWKQMCCLFCVNLQDAQLSQRDRAAGCVI